MHYGGAVVMELHGPSMKSFLGGWQNIVSGLIYHNAYTQTRGRSGRTRNRITQTVTDAITDVVRDQAVQVEFLPDVRDRIIAPAVSSFVATAPTKKVEPLSRQDNRILDSIVKIQRCYRAHRARAAARAKALQVVRVCRRDAVNVIEQPAHVQVTFSADTDFAILNRRPPRTSSDFESLYNLVDRWRILETERASRTLFRSARVAVCELVLSKEVELLRAIDSFKTAIRLTCGERKRLLDELSRPIAWQDSQGRPILVDTLRVQRARQHKHVYASLADDDLSVAERIDLLRSLRRMASLHTCNQSRELIYLVDQELNLLMRRVDTSKLNWLRNRLKLSFFQLARNTLRGDVEKNMQQFGWPDTSITRLCKTCGKLLPLEKFPRERRLRSSICVYCTSMRIRRDPRVMYEPYERILREVRHFEVETGCYGSLAFVVGVEIVRRLVDNIWHGRSGISECDDIDELRLTRFRHELEWAPWNSLLLTRTEAAVHRGIVEIETFYDARLLQKFSMRNLQAKVYFQSISKTQRNIVTPSSMEK